MRDIAMLLAFLLLLIPGIKKPFIAVSLWLWVTLFYPNGWVYGIAGSIRYNLIFSILTIVGLFFIKNRPPKEINALTVLISLFLLWVTITYFLGIGDPTVANDHWIRFIKVVMLYYCATAVLIKKEHIDFFIWAVVLSVSFYAVVEGLKLIVSGGGHQIAGIPGHVLGDRNDLALALDMAIPLVVYARAQSEQKLIKLGLLGVLILMMLCVLGTYSRGGLLGLIVLGLFFFKESDKKIVTLLVLSVIILIGYRLMPDQWFERMDTIQNANQDASFMGRVVAWKISTLIALDHPFFGGGIKALENFPVWLGYALQLDQKLTFINTPPPDLLHAHAAHSIYFQVLGDQGFVGLFLFILIILTAYLKVDNYSKQLGINAYLLSLAKMLKLSIIVYCVVGLALSMAYVDLIYAIYALVRVAERQIKSSLDSRPEVLERKKSNLISSR